MTSLGADLPGGDFADPVWDCDVLRKQDRIGDWEVDAFLGQGGFGAVYGVHAVVGARSRYGALKIYKGDILENPFHEKDRIVQEGDLLALLAGRPGIPELFERGMIRRRPYFIRERLDPLESDELPGRSDDIRAFMLQILASVKTLHDAGLVHADIKPWNIARRDADGTAMLIDFGSAHERETGEHEPMATVRTNNVDNGRYIRVDTRGYDAPELSFAVSRDIYALGHVLRDCFKTEVPIEWSHIINKCISNQPEYRYQTVDALMKDVESVDHLRREAYWALRKERIVEQRREERSLAKARRLDVTWADILQEDAGWSNSDMRVLRVQFTQKPRVHFIVKEPLVLGENEMLEVSGGGILEADISGPSSAVIVLGTYAVLHNISSDLPPTNDLTYVLAGPGSYLNFPRLKSTDYRNFFPEHRRRILRDIDATTSFRFGGPETFSGVEAETLRGIDESRMPETYKKVLRAFFSGESFTVSPRSTRGDSRGRREQKR